MLRGAARGAAQLATGNASAEGDYRLTPELIKSRCNEHNIILVTFVNAKRADYGFTWHMHLKRLRLENYLVGAMDRSALQILLKRRDACLVLARL